MREREENNRAGSRERLTKESQGIEVESTEPTKKKLHGASSRGAGNG